MDAANNGFRSTYVPPQGLEVLFGDEDAGLGRRVETQLWTDPATGAMTVKRPVGSETERDLARAASILRCRGLCLVPDQIGGNPAFHVCAVVRDSSSIPTQG